jgi:glycosyltransferase involved in cell wall biosynthesis
MRVLFLTTHDPEKEPMLWSGTALSQLRGLRFLGHDVRVQTLSEPLALYRALRWRYHYKLRKQIWFAELDRWIFASMQTQVQRELRGVDYDCLFAWLPWSTLLIETTKPKIYWYDTTFCQTHQAYFPTLAQTSRAAALEADKKAALGCSAGIYPSEWARESAIKDYGAPPDRMHVVHFGPNLKPPDVAQVRHGIDAGLSTLTKSVQLLFVGMDWERKRGPAAVAVVRELNRRNIPARLSIVGASPSIDPADQPYVDIVGRLDKTKPDQLARLHDLYLQSHFLVMASQGESYGLVYVEAMSHGLPSLATAGGGVAEMVRTGSTGLLVNWNDRTVALFSDFIQQMWSDPAKYRSLCESSLDIFEQDFRWEAAWKRFGEILDQTCAAGVP